MATLKPDQVFINDYTYTLPDGKIATRPLEKRDAAKLLVYKSGKVEDDHFFHLPDLLPSGATLILNDTRVIEARIFFTKPGGGIIEIFCLAPFHQSMEEGLLQKNSVQWKCLVGGASKWKSGQVLTKALSAGGVEVEVNALYKARLEDGFIIEFNWSADLHFAEVLHAAGAIPLPPYIRRAADAIDADRYQTIFGQHNGSVAAPTAGLHFTEGSLAQLTKKGIDTAFVTLNVGAGTFKPVKSETIAGHQMHEEDFTVTKEALEKVLASGQVIAVGTTSLRTLESTHWLGVKLLQGSVQNNWALDQWEAYGLDETITWQESLQAIVLWMAEQSVTRIECRTRLLILPGYNFKIPCGLITNFHQPQSTLLLLVAAFIGDDWRKVYQHALETDYRFLSYGDSSLLWKTQG